MMEDIIKNIIKENINESDNKNEDKYLRIIYKSKYDYKDPINEIIESRLVEKE